MPPITSMRPGARAIVISLLESRWLQKLRTLFADPAASNCPLQAITPSLIHRTAPASVARTCRYSVHCLV